MKDAFLPHWLIRFSYFHPGTYQLAYFAAFIGVAIVAYKIRCSRTSNAFRTYLLYVLYTSMFRCFLLAFLYHPYYTGHFAALLEIPTLVTILHLAWFMIRRYGIGGHDE